MFYDLKLWMEKNKRDIILFILIFLISTISFGLGYLVSNQVNRAPIIIEKNSEI